MSVKYEHPDYQANSDKWKRCNAVCGGQDGVYAMGTELLPQLTGQTDQEYKKYQQRTPFYNASWRTVVGLQGMLFRKPPEVVVPTTIVPMLDNIDLQGTPMHVFSLEVAEECLKVGRVGIFVDYPEVDLNGTAADALANNYRPSMQMYRALSIINWKTRTIKNKTILSLVVLVENRDIPKDEFEDTIGVQYRVLDLTDQVQADGTKKTVYRVRVIVIQTDPVTGAEEEVTLSTVMPMINGQYLEEIPFQFIGVDDVNWNVDEPPLIDLFDMNISHFRVSADYEHGCHFTGLPTPVITGYSVDNTGEDGGTQQSLTIGSTTAWTFPRPDAKAFYLEFTGEGLGALERNLARKEGYMAILGARMLEVQAKGGVESANTAAIHRSGEQSMLASVAQAISLGMKQVLSVFCKFGGANDVSVVKYDLNRDFFPVPMDALTLTAMVAAWQNSAMSYDTLFYNLQQAEIIPRETEKEEEQLKIKDNPPPLPQSSTTPGDPHPKAPEPAKTPATPAPTIKQLQN